MNIKSKSGLKTTLEDAYRKTAKAESQATEEAKKLKDINTKQSEAAAATKVKLLKSKAKLEAELRVAKTASISIGLSQKSTLYSSSE